jgi:hypothetical protein
MFIIPIYYCGLGKGGSAPSSPPNVSLILMSTTIGTARKRILFLSLFFL